MPSSKHSALDALLPWILPAVLVAGWEAVAQNGLVAARFLPAPSSVVVALWLGLHEGTLIRDTWVSAERALSGLAIGGGLGLLLGVVNGALPHAERLTGLTLRMLQKVPHLALMPLAILWFARDEGAAVFLVAIGVLFPITRHTFQGIRAVDARLIEMARSEGLLPLALHGRVILPGALPAIFAGLRQALGILWPILIATEILSGRTGIGAMMMRAQASAQTDVMLLGALIYALLGMIAALALRGLERRMLAWQPVFQAQPAPVVA